MGIRIRNPRFADSGRQHSHDAGERLPCIHIGMPKTATTTLQHEVFLKHSGIYFLGKLNEKSEFSHPAIDVFSQALSRHPESMPDSVAEETRDQVVKCRKSGRVVVFSREGLTAGTIRKRAAQASCFRKVFGEARVLISIREPLGFMESLYFQQLKGYNFEIQNYSRLLERFGPPPNYFSFDDWIDAIWDLPGMGCLAHLQIADTAEAYAAEFGRDNILIEPFEKLKLNNEVYYRNLAQRIGIDEEECLMLASGKSRNIRWTPEVLKFMRTVTNSRWRRWLFGYPWYRKRLKHKFKRLSASAGLQSAPARTEISPQIRQRILELSRPQCERIVRDWDCSLREFGYPVESEPQNTSHAA